MTVLRAIDVDAVAVGDAVAMKHFVCDAAGLLVQGQI